MASSVLGQVNMFFPKLEQVISTFKPIVLPKSGVFDAERFIDVIQAFKSFITAAKSGGGEDLNGDMVELGILQNHPTFTLPQFQSGASQEPPVQQEQP